MENLPFNITDIVFLVIIILSGLLSFQKGLIQEIMRILSWVGASFFALYSYSPILPYVKQYISMEIGASAVTGASSFIISLVVFYIISHFISSIVRYSPIGALNKSLGFIFGVIRGGIIMSFLYLAIGYTTAGNMPSFIAKAKTEPFLRNTANGLVILLPENFENKFSGTMEKLSNSTTQAQQLKDTYDKLNKPKVDSIGDLIDDNIQ